ncbi:pyridoxal phosphate-dependent aminotransferase [Spirochaeta cellobiosiphila]|uniref:pyridoxal phosphate-dependent aminotransferase n=1 Tax=Spirochaeta cellobiosiphila TaxID=504483 RepID=UPI000424DFEB|nr:pyridoxal phosphate-dependent aminotransferase [Spirochaeta cellobiosiphila]
MRVFEKSKKLDEVCYDIRGPVLQAAKRLEEEGYRVLKLNTGNPAPFGFDAPEELIHDVIRNLPEAQGYCDSKGLFSARKAIMQDCQKKGLLDVGIEDIYIGNGVSELITMSMQGLLNNGDELLVPSPDYPLWTAAATLSGGKVVHYICDEQAEWMPDPDDIRKKVTDRTVGIVLINPNNPTGAVYSKELLEEILEIAREHSLIVFSDEIYEKIVFDDVKHTSIATLCDDVPIVTFNGLSKAYRAAGFRSGWMYLTGPRYMTGGYREGLDILSNMRLCSNVPTQFAIQTSLGGYQSINDLVNPGGRLKEQRDLGWKMLNDIPGVSCVKPKGALYFFPKLDDRFNIKDDMQFALDFLLEKKILIVQGTGFNWKSPDHFRVVFLPGQTDLTTAIGRLGEFLEHYRQ